jgi:hypothetical protein
MMVAPEPSPMGERLRPLKRSAMNSRLPKRMVSPREKTSHDRCSPSAATASADEGTIHYTTVDFYRPFFSLDSRSLKVSVVLLVGKASFNVRRLVGKNIYEQHLIGGRQNSQIASDHRLVKIQ